MVEDPHQSGNSSKLPTAELEQNVISAIRMGRPFLWHLNADTTWVLSLARPAPSKPLGRARFNILVDPWLRGPQKDVAGWFSTQWHAIDSAVQTIDELNGVLRDIEALPAGNDDSLNDVEHLKAGPHPTRAYIDAVVISHEFTDHCHQATLLEIDPAVPILATQKAAALIRSWNHFQKVSDILPFVEGADWRETSCTPLPTWLGISRLVTKSDALYFHSAVMICFDSGAESGSAEAVIYTPHGVEFNSFSVLTSAQPPVKSLALLHGLHDISLTMTAQLNLGAHNALKAQRLLQPRYWVGTHDEIKRGGGLVSFFLRRKKISLSDALAGEAAEKEVKNALDGIFSDLESGQSLLLE